MRLPRSQTKNLSLMVVAALAMLSLGGPVGNHFQTSTNPVTGEPLPIRQGPMGVSSASPGDPYWFQQGAIGDSSTRNSVGASVMIRTVYDKLNNDAHSYWVGSLLSNNAFVQVGYLNGLTTSGQFYCCAWFYEFFPPNNSTSPPIIGPAGSAGPIGSWHTYTMNHTGNGVWAFYMDNQYLGSSPPAGNTYNLGSGTTGNNAVAALSEVAETTVRTDTIGPAEFKNLKYAPTNPNTFQPVQTGNVHIGCGQSPNSCLPNPYGVAEIENLPNDFLSGSNIPTPGPDECGNLINPTTMVLWSPTLALTCTGTNMSFSFIDQDGRNITPDWISLDDSSRTIVYTNYQNQIVPSPSGQWSVNKIFWHGVNVATNLIVDMSGPSQVFPTPYGITSNQVHDISGPGSHVAKLFSLPELITIIIPPILIAVLVAVAVARKEHQRQAMIQAQTPMQPMMGPVYCRSCGQPLSPAANFCTSCGTPVRVAIP
ncbi:zinc ribbon domain-containing protein [Candidatus Bathyarchaeota archaeon]|nr:MAG: zinc ribbon domain-containing protein [Candidatus Bathyarchaeota archaeon]